MDQETRDALLEETFLRGSYQPPSTVNQEVDQGKELIKVLTDHEPFLNVLKQELRGEQLYQDENGEKSWVQIDKPMFVKLDKNNKPLKIFNKKSKREEYICNDDAVNEVINILKSSGLNPIAPLTSLSDEEIRADLMEMESKIAVLLAVKRKEWGLGKAEYPVAVGKIKLLIKDARMRAVNGLVIKAIRTMTTRLEQSSDRQRVRGVGERINSPFKG